MSATAPRRRPAEPAEAARVAERLLQGGARLLAMTMVDNGGVTRVKCVPLRRLEQVSQHGVGMSDVWAVGGMDDHFALVPPYDTPSGDMRLVPDVGAARLLHASPGWAWAPVDQCTQELEVVPVCQRAALRRVVEAAAAEGIAFRVTFETEMTLLDRRGEPAHAGPGYSAAALAPLEGFAVALVDALEAQGIEVEQLHPEYAPGQFEVSVAPRDPVRAADEVVLLRVTARQVARAHDLEVSFAPVVLADAVGNGAHLHVSAWRDGENLMQGGDRPAGLTAEAASMVAGILEGLPDLLAVLSPSVPGYHRLQPQHWAGAYACWGVENREAALRFIPGSVGSRSRSANLEVKAGDGSANPYLAAAVVLGAALHGLAEGAPLPAPVQEDPGALPEPERARRGISRLPETLAQATDRFAASPLARSVLGATLHHAFAAVRRLEWATYGEQELSALAGVYRRRY